MMAEPISRYKRRANKIEQEIAARYLGWSGWTRQEQLEKLNRDMRWRFFSTQAAKVEEEDLSPTDFFKAAQAGPYILPGTTAGDPGPGYTGVGMNLELAAQRRLEEDEEKMYGRAGLFGMTPYGWGQ
jgi:hypothetical protein